MIAYLEGRLEQVWDNNCLVVTPAGIGYALALPRHNLQSLPDEGSSVSFYTYLAVREDALELFGFQTFAERRMFEILVGISKVGTRTALSILSTFSPDDLHQLVLEDNLQALTRVSGIGMKSAQHIFLELKYKLKTEKIAHSSMPLKQEQKGSVYRDALDALHNLGYAEEEVGPILRDILGAEPDLDLQAAMRMTLKALAQGKVL